MNSIVEFLYKLFKPQVKQALGKAVKDGVIEFMEVYRNEQEALEELTYDAEPSQEVGEDQVKKIKEMLAAGKTKEETARELGISARTLNRRLQAQSV